MFNKLIALIEEYAHDGFFTANEKLNEYITSADNFLDILSQIGTIPESINHDSTEEKIFAKVSDSVLSRAFRELGLKSTIISERADSADVIAKSSIHGYTLVADAKAFRLSRTAKNQKDFKVGALSSWRKDNNYAVLCAPYFQYPRSQSQIYAQAIDNNVCLLRWEHLIFLLTHGIKESESISFSALWNIGERLSHKVVVAEKKKCCIKTFDAMLLSAVGQTQAAFDKTLHACASDIRRRGKTEKAYWEIERNAIINYTRERAITELIKSKKIDEKIRQIDLFIRGIGHD